jgi:hypothetical protein
MALFAEHVFIFPLASRIQKNRPGAAGAAGGGRRKAMCNDDYNPVRIMGFLFLEALPVFSFHKWHCDSMREIF